MTMRDDTKRDHMMSMLLSIRGDALSMIEALATGVDIPDEAIVQSLLDDAVFAMDEAWKVITGQDR